ncbi:Crp/Fnr family transcriptional regulator [Flavobacterium aurantiibacter]|uniref:Crp/Fnr family transcriptional regulator n=1 Tax=Flavobacterium aurantiibacter TaxID=2023067 RepID=A0A255ZY56_9FLAO|nr:Crp/Fnr family transcriptional regulator [Flavobacterium aurantiibacter]OYQ46487.1 Crp/Fnr family transcriptional regulator [Flavobacterium aurantiibacter]
MKESLEEIIQTIYLLPEQVLEEVLVNFQHLEYPKNYFLLKSGKPCKHLWFMTKGAARHFYTNEQGKEMNTWFSLDTQIIVDTTSFVKQEPAHESIQLIEDSEMYSIEYAALQVLLQKHHSFALWFIKLVELHYVAQIEDRIADLQFLDAKKRYQKLINLNSGITNRVSLGNIASYLNITQETLSRIRAGKL